MQTTTSSLSPSAASTQIVLTSRTRGKMYLGLGIIVLGIILAVTAVILDYSTCATTVQASALLGIPTCDQTGTEISVSGFFSFVSFIIGIILSVKYRK